MWIKTVAQCLAQLLHSKKVLILNLGSFECSSISPMDGFLPCALVSSFGPKICRLAELLAELLYIAHRRGGECDGCLSLC